MTPPPAPTTRPDWPTVALRAVSGLGLATIAAIAAVVSYSHIHDVVLAHGESPTAAALVPISVDGLILVASLTGLANRRVGRPRSGLAILALTLGVTASLAANIAYAPPTVVGRVAAAWSPVALALGHEMLVRAIDHPAPAAGRTTVPAALRLVPDAPSTRPEPPGVTRPTKKAQLRALVAALDPDDDRTIYQLARDLAPTIDLHEGTARRYLAALRRPDRQAA